MRICCQAGKGPLRWSREDRDANIKCRIPKAYLGPLIYCQV